MNAVLILAGGSGIRVGGETPKQYLPVGGRTVLGWAIDAFARHPGVDCLVVVCHAAWMSRGREIIAAAGKAKPIGLVAGGATRMESAWNGLRALVPDVEIALIHDAARPFVPAATISAVIEAARLHSAAIPVLETSDTMIEAESADDGGVRVARAVDRSRLRRVQTPQGFRLDVIHEAFERARADQIANPTDDAGLVHRLGRPVACVPGAPEAFKITTAFDLQIAEALAAKLPG